MALDLQDEPGLATCLVSDPTDRELLEGLRTGDQVAATTLFNRYSKRLQQLIRSKCSATLARRLDADDIMQSVFHAFFEGASGGCYAVPAGEELWPLLLVIALNKIRTKGAFHRAAKRDVRVTYGWDDTEAVREALSRLAADEPIPFLKLVAEEALERMPPHQREIIELRVQGYEVEEIAHRVGRSKRTVERLLQTCRTELAKMLAEVPNDDVVLSQCAEVC